MSSASRVILVILAVFCLNDVYGFENDHKLLRDGLDLFEKYWNESNPDEVTKFYYEYENLIQHNQDGSVTSYWGIDRVHEALVNFIKSYPKIKLNIYQNFTETSTINCDYLVYKGYFIMESEDGKVLKGHKVENNVVYKKLGNEYKIFHDEYQIDSIE